MNGVTERYELKLKQSSEGIWYCDGLTLSHEQALQLTIDAGFIMGLVEEMLMDHNKTEDEPKKEEK